MNILRLPVSPDQLFVPGQMRQHPKFDLRVIRIQEKESLSGHKHLAVILPSSMRTGIFCRLGSVLLIRPVAVIV